MSRNDTLFRWFMSGFRRGRWMRSHLHLFWDIGKDWCDNRLRVYGVCRILRKDLTRSSPTVGAAWSWVSSSCVPPDRPCRESPRLHWQNDETGLAGRDQVPEIFFAWLWRKKGIRLISQFSLSYPALATRQWAFYACADPRWLGDKLSFGFENQSGASEIGE